MKINRIEESEGDMISTSSIVDIMFILIIFFLVTMSFNEEERDIAVNLPETDTELTAAAKALIINVRRDGSYFLGHRRMSLAGIKDEISSSLKRNPAQKVLIRGDRNALHGQVAAAIVVCRKCGVHDANIGYMTAGGGG